MDIKDWIKITIEENQRLDENTRGMLQRANRETGSFDAMGEISAGGIPILGRRNKIGGGGSSKSDPNITIGSDFVNLIGDEKSGYLAHNIKREYGEDINDAVKEKYAEFDVNNQNKTLESELMKLDAISGQAYSLYFVEDNKIFKRVLPGDKASIMYSADKPVFGMVYETSESKFDTYEVKYTVYAYDTMDRYKYELRQYTKESKISGQEKLVLLEKTPHLFNGRVPLVEWRNNKERRGNAERVISQIDAYDLVSSDSATEISALREAYIKLKNAGNVDDKFAEAMRKTGIIPLPEDGDAGFLEKSLNPAYLQEVRSSLEKDIFRFARIVDSAKLMDISDPRKNQIDFIYRSMDNDCDNTEKQWQRSLEEEDLVLKSFWTETDFSAVGDYETRDINYVFIRNRPKDDLADLEAMKRAGVELPNFKKLMMLGFEEEEARALSEEASEELLQGLSDDSGEGSEE